MFETVCSSASKLRNYEYNKATLAAWGSKNSQTFAKHFDHTLTIKQIFKQMFSYCPVIQVFSFFIYVKLSPLFMIDYTISFVHMIVLLSCAFVLLCLVVK